MAIDLPELDTHLKDFLRAQCPPLTVRKDNENVFEVAGTKPTMQGKQKVDGFYFASIMPKPKDVRFYFFPIYTHPDSFKLSPELQKLLKGKSCFHLKNVNDDLFEEIKGIITTGVDIYLKDNLI